MSEHGKKNRANKANRFCKERKKENQRVKREEKTEKDFKKIRIFTHQNPDLDAISSAWFVSRFMYPLTEIELVFVSASYRGTSINGNDIAVDIEAGGKGIKESIDKNGIKHCCFYTLFKKMNLSSRDYQALNPLVILIDKKDIYGNIASAPQDKKWDKSDSEAFDKIKALSLCLNTFKTSYNNNDEKVCLVMFDLFDGFFKKNIEFQLLKAEIEKKTYNCGHLVIVETSLDLSVAKLVFNDANNKAYLYLNTNSNSMGVYIGNDLYKEGFRIEREAATAIIEKLGEKIGGGLDEWFCHQDGFLLSWGTRKDSRPYPSKIKPQELALEISKLIENFYHSKNLK